MARTVPRAVGKGIGVAMHGPPSFFLSSNYPPPPAVSFKVLRAKGSVEFQNFQEVQEFMEEPTRLSDLQLSSSLRI